MTVHAVILREQARQDVDEAIAHYLGEGAEAAALGFVDALEAALMHLQRHPATGSPRYAHELQLPGLRAWSLTGYPQLVFYMVGVGHIDVWRVLHGARDIPAWMRTPEDLA